MNSKVRVKVAAKRIEARDVVSFELVHPTGEALPPFEAGAHIDVYVPQQTSRQYSLINAPGERHRYLIGVLKSEPSRGTSAALHDSVEVGQILEIGAPKNHFPLCIAKRTILLAGGIGITPLLCMAEVLHAEGCDFELHYTCRTAARVAFRDRIEQAPYASKLRLWLDDVAGQALSLTALLGPHVPGTHLYVCGPEGLLNATRELARARGWPDDHVHFEYFSGEVQQFDSDEAFELEIAATGEVITVGKGQTALAALFDKGIDIPCSCEEGVCGMCLTQVVSGTPDHRDRYLSADEQQRNDAFMPCCSRSKDRRLVIAV